jgi:unsaturated rhamnogalacturonyl hydrolase
MRGEDRSSALLAEPPRPPLESDALSRERLAELAARVAERTWSDGLDRWFWGEGVCLLGLVRVADALGDPLPAEVLVYLDRHAAAGIEIDHVNDVAPGTAAVLASSATGERRYLELVEPLAAWVRHDPAATRARNGALEHWPGGVWADTTFMVGVFLAHLGAARRDAGPLTEAGRQLVAHAEVLQDPETGLYAHGSHRDETIWCFWGRANAWCALAGVEFLELVSAVPGVPEHLVAAVRAALRRQLVALADLQPAHGVWSVLVDEHPETAGIVETSAAAGIGAAMLRAAAVVPDLPAAVTEAGARAVRGALAYVDGSGALTHTSAGTVLQLVPFGYSVIRDDRPQPWGQGLALHAIAAALSTEAGT